MTLPCIVCQKKLEDVSDGHIDNQPYNGTMFSSRGHYGSTVWDPMSLILGGPDEFLDVNICDDCLTAAADKGVVIHRTVIETFEHKTEPWGYKNE